MGRAALTEPTQLLGTCAVTVLAALLPSVQHLAHLWLIGLIMKIKIVNRKN